MRATASTFARAVAARSAGECRPAGGREITHRFGTNRLFSGQIVFKGETIERLPPWQRLKRGIGFVPQGPLQFPGDVGG